MSSEPSLRPIDLDPLRADPLISVLIPVKNYGRYIGDAINSVLVGSYANLELIVCDDGSTDESLAVIRRYAQIDDRIKVIEKPNGGQASALNAAFANCRGAIICILDADDTFHPDKLSHVADYYQTHPDIGVVVHPMILMDAKGRHSDRIPFLSKFEQGWIGDKLIRRGGRWRFMPSSALSFRRELSEYCFPIPEDRFRVNAEAFIFTILPLFTHVGYIREPLSFYRMHGSNMSGEFSFTTKTLRYRECCMTIPNEAVNERLQSMGYPQRLDLNRNLDYAMIQFKLNMLEDNPLGIRLQRYRDLFSLVLRDDLIGVGGKMLVLLAHFVSLGLNPPGRHWVFNRMISPSPIKRFMQFFGPRNGFRRQKTLGRQ